MNFDAAYDAAVHGRFIEFLRKQSREHWSERHPYSSSTLLHVAVHSGDPQAVRLIIASKMVDLNARDASGNTASHVAAAFGTADMLEVLCAAGADIDVRTASGLTALDKALVWDRDAAARVLICNGARLASCAIIGGLGSILLHAKSMEAAVLRCRRAVAALLRVKKVASLPQWDRWLLRLIALELWTTRGEEM